MTAFALESLLEKYDLPLIIIDAALKIVAINRVCETQLGISREQVIGKPCCDGKDGCRHQRFFQNLEPYSGIFSNSSLTSEQQLFRVHGFPFLDERSILYISESLACLNQTVTDSEGPRMIGESPAFLKLKTKLQQAAKTQAPLLLTGETGTGKELAAEFIHRQSKFAGGEFVVVDCSLFVENLFESELFGHERGSFTGAQTVKKGLFELANNGTLFIDEIGELPLSLQAKLLRALDTGKFRRVGGTATLSSRARIVSATNRNLVDMVKQESFREDLFYRLSAVSVEIPPLRYRMQDLPILVDYLLQHLSLRDRHQYTLTNAALMKLMSHLWPGNIRELKNCLEMATVLCENKKIEKENIIIIRRSSRTSDWRPPENLERQSIDQSIHMNYLKEVEANFIISLINKYKGNRKLIAAEMKVSERTLYRKLSRYNLK